MTLFTVIVMLLALAMLAAGLVLAVRLQRRLASLEAIVATLAERPVGLSVDDAELVADLAAQRISAAVQRASMLPALGVEPDDAAPRLSAPRIKAAGWAAGASETMRRLRQGA
jgi:hypothetical protein